jgi:hypothetical protein
MATRRLHTPHFEKIQMAGNELRQLLDASADLEFNISQHDGVGNHSDLPNLQIL